MISAMMNAAKLARHASSIDGKRLIEVLITEEGWVVRGRSIGKAETVGSAIEVDWPEFDRNTALLANAVSLVDRSLAERERTML